MKNLKQFNLIFLSMLLIAFSTPVHSFDLTLPDTGQDFCYDWNALMDCPSEGEEFYGQDANYTINPPDLTDNGNNTVTDNLTGLVWEKKTEEGETNAYTYNEALDYCDNLTLGDQEDWRIPTRQEYSTLINYGRVSPSLDTDFFPYYTTGTTEGEMYYWTISEYHDDSTQVWKMYIPFALIDKGPKSGELHKIRCVRGNMLPPASYTDNGDDTVTDIVSGLMWEQKTDDGSSRDKDNTYTWKDALAYCEDLLLGKHDDWRLPNPKELDRSVNLETSSPAIETTYFPNTINGLYWTGTTCSGCHKMKAFAIDFTDGELYYGNKFRNNLYYENYVRCVRTADVSATTTTTTAPATTTTASPQPCTAVEIYGENSDEVQLLRLFRDASLNETPEGQELIRLYYEWSPLVVKAIEDDENTKMEIKKLIDVFLQFLR